MSGISRKDVNELANASRTRWRVFPRRERTAGQDLTRAAGSGWLGGGAAEPLLFWIFRVGAAMCFIGHGAFGILTKESWVPYFAVAGIPRDVAFLLMPLVGTMDILLGVIALVSPRPAALLYMALWALWTATLRPLAGENFWEVLERAGNYGVPLAFLVWAGVGSSVRSWFAPVAPAPTGSPARIRAVAVILRWTTGLLLIGHGGFGAFVRKPMLAEHYAAVGLPGALVPLDSGVGVAVGGLVPLIGWFEILLGLAVLVRPIVPLLLFVAAWKVGTELLYPISGDYWWEFIERGASYVAPLALAVLIRAACGGAAQASTFAKSPHVPYPRSGSSGVRQS